VSVLRLNGVCMSEHNELLCQLLVLCCNIALNRIYCIELGKEKINIIITSYSFDLSSHISSTLLLVLRNFHTFIYDLHIQIAPCHAI